MNTPSEIRAAVLAETLARLEAERYAPAPHRYPNTEEVRARHASGLDDHGYPRPDYPAGEAVVVDLTERSKTA